MDITFILMSVVVGMCIYLFVDRIFGVMSGGLLVPGYIGCAGGDWRQMLFFLAVSFATYALVNFVIARFVILYGQKKWAANLMASVILSLAAYVVITLFFDGGKALYELNPAIAVLGALAPGMTASAMKNQGIKYTLPATFGAGYVTFAAGRLLLAIFP